MTILSENTPLVKGLQLKLAVNSHHIGKLSPNATSNEKNTFHRRFDHITVTIDELADHIHAGHSYGNRCAGSQYNANWIAGTFIAVDVDHLASLAAIEHNEVYQRFGYLYHTTSSSTPSAPRVRVIFRLKREIVNSHLYRRFAIALAHHMGGDVGACNPAQPFFGALGCMVHKNGATLPEPELHQLLAVHETHERNTHDYDPTLDAETLLEMAIRDGQPGNRNVACFRLACQLRGSGIDYDAARQIVLQFQIAVCYRGANEPFTLSESMSCLDSAYRRTRSVNSIIDRIEIAVMAGHIELSANVQRTAVAVLNIMRRIGKTRYVTMTVRDVLAASYHRASIRTVHLHLCHLVDMEFLRRDGRSTFSLIAAKCIHPKQDGERGGEGDTDATTDAPSQTHPVLNVYILPLSTAADVYNSLQSQAICERNAKIHPLLATEENEYTWRFGSSFQRMMAVLVAAGEIAGCDRLYELANVSERTGRNTLNSMIAAEIVTVEKIGRQKILRPSRFWQERINELSPALTTHGRDALRAAQSAGQQQAYHSHGLPQNLRNRVPDLTNSEIDELPEQKRIRVLAVRRANQFLQRDENGNNFFDVQQQQRIEERRDYMQRAGMDTSNVPPLNDGNPKPRRKTRQPVATEGRVIIPDKPEEQPKAKPTTKRVAKFASNQTPTRPSVRTLNSSPLTPKQSAGLFGVNETNRIEGTATCTR